MLVFDRYWKSRCSLKAQYSTNFATSGLSATKDAKAQLKQLADNWEWR